MKKYTTIAILAITLLGCNKKKDKSLTDLLCGHNWNCQRVTDNGSQVTQQCQITDQLVFDRTGFATDYFPIKCATTDPNSITFNWTLSTDNKTLYISSYGGVSGANITASIVQITEKTLEFKYTGSNNHVYDMTYIAK